jgi:hypothetical protein
MKSFRARTGPFTEQPFYEPVEIERICSDELRKVNLLPSEPSPIRIDRFIEKRFGVQPSYEDLPTGLLGFTKFDMNGVHSIVITTALDREGTQPAERRLRTTLAHEGGHGLLHAHLFAFESRPYSLFKDGLASDAPKILCRDDGIPTSDGVVKKKPPYRWYEYQANLAMSALLLPKDLVVKAVAPMLVTSGVFGSPQIPVAKREEAARNLADTFDVNPVVTRIRLDALFPRSVAGQQTL